MEMAKRPILTTQEYLINAALPEATDTYTVIPHGTIIDTTRTALKAKGLEIERELYRCNDGAQIASGIYHIKYGNDADMGMLFAWTNSYDKSTKFKCTMGGYVHESLSTVAPTINLERKSGVSVPLLSTIPLPELFNLYFIRAFNLMKKLYFVAGEVTGKVYSLRVAGATILSITLLSAGASLVKALVGLVVE